MKKQSKSKKMDESLGMRRGKESKKKQSYKSRRDESMGAKKSGKKLVEGMPPSKKVNMKGGMMVAGRKYPLAVEQEEYMMAAKDNHPSMKPADIGQALMKAKMGYSKKPRVRPDKKKAMR